MDRPGLIYGAAAVGAILGVRQGRDIARCIFSDCLGQGEGVERVAIWDRH